MTDRLTPPDPLLVEAEIRQRLRGNTTAELAEHAPRLLTAALATIAHQREALIAARQFMDPGISRGPAVNGWQNSLDLVEAALAGSRPSEGDTT